MFSSGPLVLGQVQPLYQHRVVVVVVQVAQVGQHAPVPESQPSSYTRLFLYFTKVEKEKPLIKKPVLWIPTCGTKLDLHSATSAFGDQDPYSEY